MSNLVAYTFEWGTMLQSHIIGKTCSKGLNGLIYCVYEKSIYTPGGCLPLPWGYIHVYDHYFQSRLANHRQISCGASLGRGKESLYKWSRSHDPDGHHAHIWLKHSKIISYRINGSMILKLGMEHYELKLYKVYINEDLELTLTYFTTMSNLAKLFLYL